MVFLRKYSFEIQLGIHALMGIVCSFNPQLVIAWVLYIIFLEGTVKVYFSKNTGGQAHLAAAYMASMEMIVRMSRSGLPHELTKYAVIFILLNGLLVKPRIRNRAWIFILFFFLLTPSILLLINTESLEQARQAVSFNLAGPLCLVVASIYFYRRPLPLDQLIQMFQRFLLPIAATVAWLFVRTPSISELSFEFAANFEASGYGPNQMASVLGFGILLIGIGLLFRLPVFQSNSIAFIFLGFLAYRGLLTFSRGGMLTPVLVLTALIIYFLFSDNNFRKRFRRWVFVGIIFSIGLYGVFTYINKQTAGALENRYVGISYGKQVDLEKYSSGRLEILKTDLAIFGDHPFLGIGPGMGNDVRVDYGYRERAAAHIEYSRLLAEHGLFGFAALIILVAFPILEFRKRKAFYHQFLLIVGVFFCFAFMAHSATRIALPMLLYGFGFVVLLPGKRAGKFSLRYPLLGSQFRK